MNAEFKVTHHPQGMTHACDDRGTTGGKDSRMANATTPLVDLPLANEKEAQLPVPDPGRPGTERTYPPLRSDLELLGRFDERRELDGLLDSVRAGNSRTLVLRGEAGIGKSALLDHLTEGAGDCRIVRTAGAPSETELGFAALHQICTPFLDRLQRLPEPQAKSLEAVIGLREEPSDALAVGLALLRLLSDVSRESPVICAIDDAQWLDLGSLQALTFAARRLDGVPVGIVFATRNVDDPNLALLPALTLGGLGDDDARSLLCTHLTGPVDPRIEDRIVDEARGNPLALLAEAYGTRPEKMAGGFGLPDAPGPLGGDDGKFRRQLEGLPAEVRLLLVAAAADELGDPLVLYAASEHLGLGPEITAAAVDAGMLEINGLVRFTSPALRRVVYLNATPEERRAAHRALAEINDVKGCLCRRAWHRSHAITSLDGMVAAELEKSALQMQSVGATAACAAFLERSAELTPDPGSRARRALAAAQAKHRVGAPEVALRLLSLAESGPLDESSRARVALERAQVARSVSRGGRAPTLLLDAAGRIGPLDPQLAREAYRDAYLAAISAGSLADVGSLEDTAQKIARAGLEGHRHGLMLHGLARVVGDGYEEGAPRIKEALRTMSADPPSDGRDLRWLRLGSSTARTFLDDTTWEALSARQLEMTRHGGVLAALPIALVERFSYELLSGNFSVAVSMSAEVDTAITATDAPATLNRALWLAAWCGRDDEAAELIGVRRQDALRRGEGQWQVATEWLSLLLFNGLGRYDDALAATAPASRHPFDVGLAGWILPEIVEASVRSNDWDRAQDPARRFQELARASGSEWALGLLARCEALLSDGDDADLAYRESLERLGRTQVRPALARTHLVYGEWLRRQRRRSDAREHLRAAYEMLEEMGAAGFAERARRELIATGERARRRSPETIDDLTAQELEIAKLAAGGRTNPEIGEQLYLSPRTIEWHLRKVFGKLGIRSRKELAAALIAVRAS